MGNAVPRRSSREAGTAAAGTVGSRSESSAEVEAPAAPMRVSAARREQRNNVEREEEVGTAREGRRRAGVSWAGDGDGTASAGTAVTVKIVMRRKDAEALVARLHAQGARERKAGMAELRRQLRAGDDGGGGASPAPYQEAWKPGLAPVQENQS